MHPSLTIVIPCYNEEKSLPVVVPALMEFAAQQGFKVIIVNDGSKDNSKSILENFAKQFVQLNVLHHKVNRGYGGAIKTGITAADTELVITIDADGQHNLNDVVAMRDAMISSEADMIIGARGTSGSSLFRNTGKWLIRKTARILIPNKISDLNSGIKIYRRELAMKYISLCPDGMAYSDVIALIFINQKHLVSEMKVSISNRVAGKSTIGISTAFDTVREILNILMLFNPMRLLMPIAIVLIVASLAWEIPILVRGDGLSVGALLGIMLGFLCFVIGLLAEQLSKIRQQEIRK
jgi:glycosyltransferase involved in cell wall biosynthesis